MKARSLCRFLCEQRETATPVAFQNDVVYTQDQFREQAAAVAGRFSQGQSVALFCRDSYLFAVGLFGLLHAGCRIILPPSDKSDILQALQNSFDAIVKDADVLDAGYLSGTTLLPINETAENIVFFTSGSTGEPKQITKSLAMFAAESTMCEARFGAGLPADARVFATVPHQHLYGMSFKLLWPLSYGRAFCADTHAYWETLLAEPQISGSVIISSPAHLSRLTGISPLPGNHQPARILSAGAPLSRTASDDAAGILGCRPTEIFGSTESGAIATRLERECENDPWHVLADVSIRTDCDGRMIVQSPAAGQDQVTLSDLVTLTKDGFVHHGRADRIVKIEGKRINLINVEKALRKLDEIETAAVITLPTPLRLAAVVVPSTSGREQLLEIGTFRFSRALRQELADSIDPAGLPRQWRFLDNLPGQPMGKLRVADIRALFGEKHETA